MRTTLPFASSTGSASRGVDVIPATRLLAGAALLAACLIADPATAPGAACAAASASAAFLLFRPDVRTWSRFAALGLAMFAPVFLLTPWTRVAADAPPLFTLPGVLIRLPAPWRIFARGEAALLVTGAVTGSLTASDLQSGLARLPLPRFLVAITAQIVHQAGMLAAETQRIGQAMAVRGATSGLRASALVAASLPSTWLPRVVRRADRVSAAMDLRGFDGVPVDFASDRFATRDAVLLLAVVSWLALAVLVRWEWPA